MKSKKPLYDSILIIAFFLIAVVLIFINRSGEKGTYAIVESNGKTVAEISLEKDAEYSFNDGRNILAVENGCVYMKYAECKGQDCVKQGKKNAEGQSIVCLPNRFKVTVKQNDGGVDLVI